MPSLLPAQRLRREYTPSAVAGTAWNAPANANPFIPGYFADPTIRRFGDTYYLYATTDGTGNGYGPAQVWASRDFVNWQNIVMNWPTTEVVWAPDVVQQPNGRFRYYYCEPCVISIGESDTPIGPWKNILGEDDAVMVPDRYVHNAITLDPQLFRDDDGQEYLYFTTWGIYNGFGCGVAKLRKAHSQPQQTHPQPLPKGREADSSAVDISDGKSIYSPPSREGQGEEPQGEGLLGLHGQLPSARHWHEDHPFPIAADTFFSEKRLIPNTELKDIFEAPFVFKRGGIYYFTYSSGSCHTDTYRVQYATSKVGPMGPFEYKGELLTTNEDLTVHGPGHHSVIEIDGRYYIVYHRHNIQKSVHGFNRQVCIDELTFDAEGNILPVVPTHNAQDVSVFKASKNKNLAFGATVTASSYYDEQFKPEYAVDDNNATLWKARHGCWDGPAKANTRNAEWLQMDLGKPQTLNEVWTQFEYPTFFYQYKIETSLDGQSWTLYADRSDNTMQGSPMIDRGKAKARYLRITILDTQKNGHMPAIWNVKVWKKAPQLPYTDVVQADGYPGMHQKDVPSADRHQPTSTIVIDAAALAKDAKQPFDVTELTAQGAEGTQTQMTFKANKPIRARVKDGHWALFFNGTQHLSSVMPLSADYRYNAPWSIVAWVYSTKTGPVATLASLSTSRADLATTELRLGTDPQTGLMNHNGSFESYGAPTAIKEGEGRWQLWVATFDGWMERVYADGQLVHEQNNFLMVRPEGRITIGADGSGSNHFQGYISQLSIMPRSMAADEVKLLSQKLRQASPTPSLGDDDFEETDPDSKFTLPATMKPVYEQKAPFRLEGSGADFNDAPLQNGAHIYKDVEGDFVVMARVSDMEGLSRRSITSYNEVGLIIADERDTYYQLGAFPLYNCGNMLTVLSRRGRPQYPNYKGYGFDPLMQFERRGDKLFARTSTDGVNWQNMPGSPIEVKNPRLRVGVYQTTYTDHSSWGELSGLVIYQ